MSGLDAQIAGLSHGGSLVVLLAVAILLGLRHASDPDHLTAVSTLIASQRDDGVRRAARLGVAWGAGHATTLVALGLPIVLFRAYLPPALQRASEILVGLLIMALAIRLLVRWRHAPAQRLGRSPLEACAIGMVHGIGGSAGIGILLLAGIADTGRAVAALVLFAAATALSMTLLSSMAGWALTRGPLVRRALVMAPALGLVSLTFGVFYVLGAAGAVG